MKNITLSAEEELIEEARSVARAQRSTLNQLFREWLVELTGRRNQEQRVEELMARLSYARSAGPFSREEMNER